MKIKSLLFVIAIILLQWSCKKDTETNNFKFTSISGAKSGTSGIVTFMWSDSQNSNWNVIVKNPNGTTRTSFNTTD
ncbi:MAG: hypothetical protein IPL21_06360, partial [Saprospirales bacterium]|nr:hypothetical protein [Saprospirales bacterium]